MGISAERVNNILHKHLVIEKLNEKWIRTSEQNRDSERGLIFQPEYFHYILVNRPPHFLASNRTALKFLRSKKPCPTQKLTGYVKKLNHLMKN